MNDIIILIVSMAFALSGGIISKHLSFSYKNSFVIYNFYNSVMSLVAAFVLIIMSSTLKASSFTIFLAITFGAVTGLQITTRQLAFREGSFAYTSMIISLSSLIPTLSGAVIWGEKIKLIQIVGIALMVICFVFSVDTKEKKKESKGKWFFSCFAAFLCTGLIGVMQKWHQSSFYKDEIDSFLIISFLFSFAFSAFLAFFGARTEKKNDDGKKSVFAILPIALMVFSGVCAALNNKYNLYLSGVIDSAVLFPILNGGGMILNLLAALAIFREKLLLRQWCGILIGIVAVILLCAT